MSMSYYTYTGYGVSVEKCDEGSLKRILLDSASIPQELMAKQSFILAK